MAQPRQADKPPRDGDIFVDREGPKRLFEKAAFAIPAKGASLLVFYGPGGQGKTALCRELFRITDAQADPSYGFLRRAAVYLHGRPKTDPDLLLVWVRNEFARAGVALPAFDLALALAWEATRPEQAPPRLVNAWLAKSADFLVDVAPDAVTALREVAEKTVETIPGLGPLAIRIARWSIDRGKRAYLRRSRETLQALYDQGKLKEAHELPGLLPEILARDLNHHLGAHPDERFVLFVDEYEGVFDQGGAGARWRENPFDRHLRTLVAECDGLLAVFLGRERLPWAEDPDWRDDLAGAQHPLDGLAREDAEDWLRRVPVEDETLRRAILDGARERPEAAAAVYPLLLDLQVEHWRSLVAAGETPIPDHFHVAAATFEGRRRELVERVLRDYGAPLQATLERLSVAARFDRAAFADVVTTFATGLPLDHFDRIAGLSFVTPSEDGFLTLHRAMAEVIRETLDEDRRRTSVAALFEHFEARATVESPREVTDDTVTALTEAAELRQQMGVDGFVDWLGNHSDFVTDAARYAADEQLWRTALQFVEKELGPEHPDTATSYNNVAYNFDAQGRHGEAAPLYRKALDIRQRVLGEEHLGTATSYNNVAANLDDQGRHGEAEPLFRTALDIRQRVLGEEHPDTATSYNNVASNLDAQGRHGEAEPLVRKALDIRQRVLGEEHPDTATSYNNVASNLNAQGRHGEAEPLFRGALDIRQRVLGEEHPDTATSYNNVASNLNAQGRHGEAEPLYRKALVIRQRVLGEEHPSTAASYNNVAYNLDNQGRHGEAEPLYRKALDIRQRVLGEEHPDTAASYNNVAYNLNAQGRYEEAEPLIRKAVDISRRVLGDDHPHTKLYQSNLEEFLRQRGS